MTYTLLGDKDIVTKEINKIISKYSDIVYYDLEIDSLSKILEDVNTISMFSKRVVVALNINEIKDITDISLYLDNPGDNVLILCSYKAIDKKLNDILKTKSKYLEMFKYDLSKYVKECLEGFKMDNSSINLLISFCDNDIGRVLNELEKLKLYKFEEKVITNFDIEKLVRKSFDSTIFNLIDSINYRNKSKVYSIYNELIKQGESDEKIMYTIANHYRLLFQVRKKLEFTDEEVLIKELKMHPYRFKKLKEQFAMVSEEDNLLFLKRLSDIDIDIKSGKKTSDIGLFMFFENL